MKIFTALALLVSASVVSANTLLQNQMNLHAAQVESLFYTYYAPAEFKRTHLGWDFRQSMDELKLKVSSGELKSAKEYHRALHAFFNTTDDYHVSVQFHSTEQATLPLVLKPADQRVFIAHIDRKQLSEEQFPFAVGDEVVTFAGAPAFEEVLKLSKKGTDQGTHTNIALATMSLTRRRAARGLEVPQGEVALQVRRNGEQEAQTVQLAWNYIPESIALQVDNPTPLDDDLLNPIQPLLNVLGSSSLQPVAPVALAQPELDLSFLNRRMEATHLQLEAPQVENLHQIGGNKSFVPTLGPVTTTIEQGFFYTYIFEHEGKKVGVIRIPSYDGAAKETAEFMQKIAFLEQLTDALVIDQVNNPGGSVPFLYSLVSLLATKEMPVPRHKTALTQEEVMRAQIFAGMLSTVQTDEQAVQFIGREIGGYPVDLSVAQNLQVMFETQVKEWAAGNRLTTPVPLSGVDIVKPHSAGGYSKPILVLVNELDFSGGDFFPAIMQDNARAKILGVKTSGAGGYVLDAKIPNLLGVSTMRFTGSIAERLDKQPIENLGVQPDIKYSLTADDLQNGYQGYKAKILEAVSEML